MLGVTQPNGAIIAPRSDVPANCELAMTISGVARSRRVVISSMEKHRLPDSAITARQLTLCAEGFSAITTPAKPIRIALQRRQPTCSRNTVADSAVTKIGHAR